jgi:hypothetical protein
LVTGKATFKHIRFGVKKTTKETKLVEEKEITDLKVATENLISFIQNSDVPPLVSEKSTKELLQEALAEKYNLKDPN